MIRDLTRESRFAVVNIDDLVRELDVEETQIRVAINMLESVDLVKRHFDVPASIAVTLTPKAGIAAAQPPAETVSFGREGHVMERDVFPSDTSGQPPLAAPKKTVGFGREGYVMERDVFPSDMSGQPPLGDGDGFDRFLENCRLRVNQRVLLDSVDLAQRTSIAPHELEGKLLAWRDEGYLLCHGSGRVMLIERLPAEGVEKASRRPPRAVRPRAGRPDRKYIGLCGGQPLQARLHSGLLR